MLQVRSKQQQFHVELLVEDFHNKFNFVSQAREIDPVQYEVGDSAPQSPRYAKYNRLFSAKNLTELFE